jgi:hypothetical protein
MRDKMRLSKLTVAATGAVLATAAWSLVGSAQTIKSATECSDPKLFDKLPKLPQGCQREKITASGGMRPTTGLAMGSAEKEWRREVVTKYGERFLNLDFAVCQSTECVPAAISGLKRCSISAIPCAVRGTFVGGSSASVTLSEDEIKEIQRFLKVKADGKWGSGSTSALERWQRSQKMAESGEPTKEILDRIRGGRR